MAISVYVDNSIFFYNCRHFWLRYLIKSIVILIYCINVCMVGELDEYNGRHAYTSIVASKQR